ncbi:hypothetical protein BbiDN127_D0014 (plasmid) [Borreliella bissettiae DN127]|uniref:Uncharacterized protein n=1 Tax=Borrelia bissettiae (strain DSM 17990 / CIP 109136 / DN127) TaxID=521010 RepID=G0ANZ0_BORBD|nr:hypothetical protein BbiDN127_D0014 [Borreliella bissettiae DN127]
MEYSFFNRNSESVVIGDFYKQYCLKFKKLYFIYLKLEDFDFNVNKKIFACMAIYIQKECQLALL